MTREVLVVGESLIDEIREAGATARRPGGSPMNVAIGLARLGVVTDLATHLGDDADGRTIVSHVREAGARVLPTSIAASPTGVAIATMRADGAADYEFDLDWDFHVGVLDRSPGWVHVGSIATFVSPGAEKLHRFFHRLAGRARLSYDPNIRAGLIPEHKASFARFEEFARLADVVKLSDEDAEWLYGHRTPDEILDEILALGAHIAILTQGERGAYWATRSHRIHVGAPAVAVVDTIGAGDSYMAATIWQLNDRTSLDLGADDMGEIGRVAAAAAAITCGRLGANPPFRSELLSRATAP